MKRNNTILIIQQKLPFVCSFAVIFSAVFICSCTKNVLDKTPASSYTDDAVWKSTNLITAFVDNTYRVMPTGYTYRSLKLATLTDEIYRRGGGNNVANAGNVTAAALGMLDFWVSPNGYSYSPTATFFLKILKLHLLRNH